MKVEVNIHLVLNTANGYKEINLPVDAPVEFLDDAIDTRWAGLKQKLGDKIRYATVGVFYPCATTVFDRGQRIQHYNGQELH